MRSLSDEDRTCLARRPGVHCNNLIRSTQNRFEPKPQERRGEINQPSEILGLSRKLYAQKPLRGGCSENYQEPELEVPGGQVSCD